MNVYIYNFKLRDGRVVQHSTTETDYDKAWRACDQYDPGLFLCYREQRNIKGLTHVFLDVCVKPSAYSPPARPAAPAPVATNPNPNPTKINTMFNAAALKSQFFAQVACVVISLLDQKVGIKAADGNIKTAAFPAEGAPTLVDNPFTDLSATIPAFAIRTPIADVKKEDIILLAGQPVWVVEYKDGVLKVLRTDGSLSSLVIAENALFKDKAVMRVTNPFAGAAGDGLSSLLPLMLMSGEGESLPENLGLMLALGGLGGKGGIASNPLMLMALMGKGGLGGGAGGIDFKTIMLMQAMGGGKDAAGLNPLLLMALAK